MLQPDSCTQLATLYTAQHPFTIYRNMAVKPVIYRRKPIYNLGFISYAYKEYLR